MQFPARDISDQSSNKGANEMRQFILSRDDQYDSPRNNERVKKIFKMAITNNGVTYLCNLVRDANQEEFGNFVSHFVVSIRILMTDKCGRRLVLDVLERCDAVQIHRVVDFVCRDIDTLKSICLNVQGCESMKTLIRLYLMTGANMTTVPGSDRILEALRPICIDLTENHVGCQIILMCFELFAPHDTCYIALEIAPHCPNLAMDPVGCQSVQAFLQMDNVCRRFILEHVVENAFTLSHHQYGNYVVQCVLKLKDFTATNTVMARLSNSFVTLSMNKFGSNVVEACLREGHPFHVAQIIVELVMNADFLEVLQDQYGNFVAQSALKRSKLLIWEGRVRVALNKFLVDAILWNAQSLQGHIYGSKVLDIATGKKGHRNHGPWEA